MSHQRADSTHADQELQEPSQAVTQPSATWAQGPAAEAHQSTTPIDGSERLEPSGAGDTIAINSSTSASDDSVSNLKVDAIDFEGGTQAWLTVVGA